MRRIISILSLVILLAACNVSLPQDIRTPTPEAIVTAISPSPTTRAEPSRTPTATNTVPPLPVLETPTASYTPGPPTATSTPTETPGPYEHTMAQGETLIYIVQLYGYTDLSIIDEVVAMNSNIASADRLPGAGAVILIPRQTATATPIDFTPSPTPENPVDNLPRETTIIQHSVRQGETIVGIAGQYETTLPILDQLNPELLFLGCDFSNPSGGPECNVPLSVDQLINVPAPTPTPTLSPTPSGSETPTPTPTFAAPMMVFPPDGATAQGNAIDLQWVSIGVLPPDYQYLVEVENVTSGETHLYTTRETAFTVGEDAAPPAGEAHDLRWRVRVGTYTEAGTFRPLSADSTWRTFRWRR